MDKEAVVRICNGILLNHKKEYIWICSNEMDKTRTHYTEWSQKEKYKYCVMTYVYGIWKYGTDEFIFRAAVEKQT